MKNILFISYWGIHDVLTQATVLPQLSILQQLKTVGKIVLVTIERESSEISDLKPVLPTYVTFRPFFTGTGFIDKISDFTNLPTNLYNLTQQHDIHIILAHGSPAGALAYKVWQKSRLPFYVSSFEPHAGYMLESGVWSKFGLKYNMQKNWEEQQKKYAAGLMPVANNYKKKLLTEGIPEEKIKVVPCIVDASVFRFSTQERETMREKLKWQRTIVGVYAGKYGGLYYNDEAFEIYQLCFKMIPDFRLLILSPQPKQEITAQLLKYKIDIEKVFITTVSHEEVSAYLSAADFAFATIKSYPSARYCSPVKIGEYWANGLPVLLTEGIGDDSDIIKSEGGGAVFNLAETGSIESTIQQIRAILNNPTHRQEIPELAAKYRSPDKVRQAYEYFFNQLLPGA